ncbi:MAG: PRC-barrel domain-containing protein [Akkermansiaceae bacterium]|nr:PRC-barrel domain-containing protein [Verrucomicrobiales bacterium]
MKLTGLLIAGLAMATGSAGAADQKTNSFSSTNARSLGNVERLNKVIGREVRNQEQQKLGQVNDLVIDLESGRILYAVISVGGFVGVGDRLVAVPVSAFQEAGEDLRLDVNRQQLSDAPQFSKAADQRAETLTPAFASRVNKHFGEGRAWWESATGQTGEKFGNAHPASDLIGLEVSDVSNRKIGEVNNVMVDLSAGRVPYVIFAPEKSLDLNADFYAWPPNVLTPSGDGKSLTTGIDQSKLASAPHFKRNHWPNMSNRTWGLQVYEFYGKQPYFESEKLQPTSTPTNSLERIYHEPPKQ